MAASKIVAQPLTITGSIGVVTGKVRGRRRRRSFFSFLFEKV
jgi:ClpP class serine protease